MPAGTVENDGRSKIVKLLAAREERRDTVVHVSFTGLVSVVVQISDPVLQLVVL